MSTVMRGIRFPGCVQTLEDWERENKNQLTSSAQSPSEDDFVKDTLSTTTVGTRYVCMQIHSQLIQVRGCQIKA